jgi:hypothetical protein
MVGCCVHEFFAREICLLQSKNPSLWVPTSSMQPLQADVEHPHKETRSQALAKCARFVGSHFGARTIAEESDAAHWPYAASHGTPLASGHATVCVGNSGFALANRPGPLVLLSGIISETVKGDRLLFCLISSFHSELVGPVDAWYFQVQIDLRFSSASLFLQKVFGDSLIHESKPAGLLITVRRPALASLPRLPLDRDRLTRSDGSLTMASH